MPAKASTLWTKAEDDMLRAAYKRGDRPGEIAKQIGRGKNSVIGRACRLGISTPRHFQPLAWKPKKLAPAVLKRSAPMPLVPPMSEKRKPTALPVSAFDPLPGKTPVPIIALKDRHCRWPVTGGSCGCTKIGSGPYCGIHTIIASRGLAGVKEARP